MADKPTTPETPQGASQGSPKGGAGCAPQEARGAHHRSYRHRSAAGCIGWRAATFQRSAATAACAGAACAQTESAQMADNNRSGKQPKAPSARVGMPTLVAAISGAGIMFVVLIGLWLSGLVPVRNAEPTAPGAMDSKAIDALGQRLSKIEDTAGKLPASDPALAARIATADNAMKSLGLALTALNRRSDDVAANAANARERAEAAEKAVAELRASVQDAAKNTAAGLPPAELDDAQKRIAALEQSAKLARDDIAKTAATDTPARLALSAAALRDAVVSGAPFAAELAQAKSLGADDKALAPLEPFAATGIPTQIALAKELRVLMPILLNASNAQAPAGGFLERLQANAGKLVHKIPMDAPQGDDPSAVLARIEIAAANADIAAALADLNKLPDASRAPAQGWITKAQTRQTALDAARSFAADSARALGQR